MVAELASFLTSTPEQRLEQAEGEVRGYCGWHIAPEKQTTMVLDGPGSATLLLDTLHVTTVEAVRVDGVSLATDAYRWSTAGVITRLDGRAWLGRVEVDLTHGHSRVPPEVTGIVQAVAQRAVNNPGSNPRRQAGPFTDTNSQAGSNQAPPLALLDSEKATLSRYRIPRSR